MRLICRHFGALRTCLGTWISWVREQPRALVHAACTAMRPARHAHPPHPPTRLLPLHRPWGWQQCRRYMAPPVLCAQGKAVSPHRAGHKAALRMGHLSCCHALLRVLRDWAKQTKSHLPPCFIVLFTLHFAGPQPLLFQGPGRPQAPGLHPPRGCPHHSRRQLLLLCWPGRFSRGVALCHAGGFAAGILSRK